MHPPTSIPQTLSKITTPYTPHLIAALNDHHLKLAILDGPFIWHAHAASDELFYVLSGTLRMELEERETVVLNAGDVFVVPRGVRHRPVGLPEGKGAEVLVVEREGTVNTGEEGGERTVEVKDVRGGLS